MTVQFGATAVNADVFVTAANAPILSVPQGVETPFGKLVSFTVSAIDPAGLVVVLSVSNPPDGATFDPGTGKFSWTPAESQQGAYDVPFTASNSAAASSTGRVAIIVDSGKPVITGIHNAANGSEPACSPGSVASLAGRWLASAGSLASDPSGAVTELVGTRVKVNGEYAPVVYASPTRVDFVCPDVAPGRTLMVSAENKAGIADPVSTVMYRTVLGIYSVDGTGIGQGAITLAGTSLLATSRDYRILGQPAEPGDSITIRATGLAAVDGPPQVRIGGFYALVQSVQAVPGAAGIYEITAQVPVGIQEGDAVPVVVGLLPDRSISQREHLQSREALRRGFLSNLTTIAVERSRF
jgi:uncharacterized protein (TIGR03437 family)